MAGTENLRPWRPGQSGNPGGRPKKRVLDEGLKSYLKDNVQAWQMDCNGFYQRKARGRSAISCAQTELLQELGQPLGAADAA